MIPTYGQAVGGYLGATDVIRELNLNSLMEVERKLDVFAVP